MNIAIIGGGPAGLMAAETASATGAQVISMTPWRRSVASFSWPGKAALNLNALGTV